MGSFIPKKKWRPCFGDLNLKPDSVKGLKIANFGFATLNLGKNEKSLKDLKTVFVPKKLKKIQKQNFLILLVTIDVLHLGQ